MDEGKKGEVPSASSIKRDVLRDIRYLSTKGLISDNEVYYLIKNFLKKLLNLKYEFTKEELMKELKNIYLPFNVREDFFKFIDQVFMFEYSKVNYSEEELRSFLDQFKGYLDYLLVSRVKEEKKLGEVVAKRWFDRLLPFLKRNQKKEEPVITADPTQTLQEVTPEAAKHTDLNSLVEKIYYSLYNSDIVSAKDLYKQVLDLYHKMSAQDKQTYYELIQSTYEAIRNSRMSS